MYPSVSEVHAGSFRVSVIHRTSPKSTRSFLCLRIHTRAVGTQAATQDNILDSENKSQCFIVILTGLVPRSVMFNNVESDTIQFNSTSYLLRVEHDKLTENWFFSRMALKKRDNKSKRKKRKRDTKGNITSWRRERQKTSMQCINASMNNSEQTTDVCRWESFPQYLSAPQLPFSVLCFPVMPLLSCCTSCSLCMCSWLQPYFQAVLTGLGTKGNLWGCQHG